MSNLNLGRDLYLKGRIGWRGLSKDEYLSVSDYRIINATALMDGFVDWDNCGYISKERYDESPEIMLQEGDLLISKDGTLGKIGYVKGITKPCTVASGIFVLRNTIPDVLNFDYLYHVLKSHIFKGFIARNQALGSTISHLYQSDLENFEMELPSLDDQELIASVLNTIDAKIANNNAICSNLEAMAKLLYDYWFVQFDFPDENGKPYKSSGGKMIWNDELKREIPTGWKVKRFDEVLMFQKGRIPDELLDVEDADHNTQYITINVANNGIPQYCSSKGMVPCNGQTLMVMDGAASGDVYIGYSGSLGSTLAMLPSKRNDVSDPLIYMMLKSNMPIYKRANVGSTVPHANRSFIEQMKIALPNDAKGFSIEFDKIFLKIVACKNENQQLASLRDFLLPMLMNGQVKVSA